MPDIVTDEERALIDAAVAEGRVRVIPQGEGTFRYPVVGEQFTIASGAVLARQKQAAKRREKVIRLAAEGLSISQIADKLGVPKGTIAQDYRILGTAMRRPALREGSE